jgi:glycosyltransferase involved in cell wall biosynthesis
MSKKIIFIRPKPWPLANIKVADALAKQFPDCDMEIINIEDLVKKKISIVAINTVQTWLNYGKDILAGHKNFKAAFWRTPYIFHTVKRLLKQRLSDQEYLFTFQIQSLFDCSLPNVPHFVYADHTHLANLNYIDFNIEKLYSKKWTALEKQVYDNADKIFVRSSNIEKSVIEQYHQPADKVTCVYAGNNIETDNSITKEKSYTEQNILFVGIDWKRKGGPDLLEAFNLALKKHPNATLTIAGAEPNLHIKNCKVIGKVAPKDLISHYEAATLFCMPTRVEPFGIAFLEAMQSHLPIIGTKVGAIPDFLQNEWNGILVEPGDIQSIANAIIKLLDNPDLCRLYGDRNFNLIQERYSWLAVSQKMHAHITAHLSLLSSNDKN